MQQSQTIKPQKLNLDIHPKYLPVDSAFYILNNEVAVNPNGGTNNGASLGKSTPVAANYPACEIEQPAGENYTILKYYSERTNESYSGVLNSNGVNYLQRINSDGVCEIVYHDGAPFAPIQQPIISPIIGAIPFINGINTGNITGTPGDIINVNIQIIGGYYPDFVTGTFNGGGTNYQNGTIHTQIYPIVIPSSGSFLYSLVFTKVSASVSATISASVDYPIYAPCLNFNPDPKHSVEQWRCWMRVEKICKNRDGKYLQWVDGDGGNYYIDTEASIATNFFTTPFFNICRDTCAYINLCVPQPCGCLHAEFLPLELGDQGLSNYLVDRGFKFMFKHVYYDGRASEWSDRSSLYYQDIRKCFFDGIGASRCIKFRLPIGNPLVEKIIIGFSDDGGTTWYEYETVEKYKKYNSSQDKWYNRELSETISSPDANFSLSDCSFDYIFCNDKEKKSIAPLQVSRVRNPYPRKPQFLLPIGEGVGYGNYEDGNCPVDKTEIEKINIDADCPVINCDIEYAIVTVRAVIHTVSGNNSFIYILGSGGAGDDLKGEKVYFGGNAPYRATGESLNSLTYGQEFKDKIENFIPYIEGTDYWGEMKQWKADPLFVNPLPYGVVRNMDAQDAKNNFSQVVGNGAFFFQEYKFKVPKGTKGFVRMPSHEVSDGLRGSQNTSATVLGITNLSQYKGNINIRQQTDLSRTEIEFDTCDGDTDLDKQAFVISDIAFNANPDFDHRFGRTAFSGYIKDSDGVPIEGALLEVKIDGVVLGVPLSSPKTDHNGFYYFEVSQTSEFTTSITVNVQVELSCAAFSTIQTFFVNLSGFTSQRHDEQIRDTVYTNGSNAKIELQVLGCTGIPASGIIVAISGSKARITNPNGIATFKIRNYSTRNRSVRLIVMDNNGCFTQDCLGNCNPCAIVSMTPTQSCYFLSPPTFTLPPVKINIDSIIEKVGLKSGGQYPFGIVIEGDCGMLSSVYELKTLNIQRTQEKKYLSFCRLKYNMTGLVLPDWAKCLKIVRGANRNPFELQWIVDKVQRDGNGRLVLTVQSLIDYNTSFFDKTNTIYQWLEGDRIEFIRNGDGFILTTQEYGLLNYLIVNPYRDISIGDTTSTDVNYYNQLVIIDDGRLFNLKEGAIIELQRKRNFSTETEYKEICASFPVTQIDNGDGSTHGEVLNPIGFFTTFDTYLILRKANNILSLFEHHSPSDFWGAKLDDTGKVHFVNRYENEKRLGRNVTISSPTQVNYFGDLVKTFDGQDQGDIIAMRITDDNILQVICEHDIFVAQKARDFLQLGSSGIVRAQSADAIITDPQANPTGTYGCQYDHIGSILFFDGGCAYADVNKFAYVVHDYSIAKDVSENSAKLYTQKRFQEIQFVNRITPNNFDKLRFATGQHSQNKNIYLTIKKLRDSGINNENKSLIKTNDTIVYNPIYKEWRGFTSFTPEGYSQINLFDGAGAAFITYLNGIPYYHPIIAEKWNEFYGSAVDWIFGICANQFQNKEKVFIAMELQSETLFFSPEIETDDASYISEITPIKPKMDGRKWNAGFMGNKNSRDGLFGSKLPKGYYLKMLLIRDNTDGLKYQIIDNSKRVKYSELDEIIVKFTAVEQTGLTQ